MDTLISLGLDIGSSTTKLVFCRLTFARVGAPGALPKVAVVGRELLHASALHRTALLPDGTIDGAAVEALLAREYAAAGLKPEQVGGGAVLVTGESALRANAARVIDGLAAGGGKFVVAVAGADLEGLLAGRGAGAAERARATGKVVANVDIGGATANVAVFAGDRLAGTCTLLIGGRMVERDPRTGDVTRVSPALARYAAAEGLGPDLPGRLVATLARCLAGALTDTDRHLLLGPTPAWGVAIDEVTLSGGVPACLDLADGAFCDLGQDLARALRATHWRVVPNPGRATVLGAGAQSAEISGATVHVAPGALPLRDLPVCRAGLAGLAAGDDAALATGLATACAPFAEAPAGFALALTGWPARPTFAQLQRLARALAALPGWRAIVMEADLAQALGQALALAAPARPVVCLDGLAPELGDYLDLAEPLPGSGAVPAVIKTLVFQASGV